MMRLLLPQSNSFVRTKVGRLRWGTNNVRSASPMARCFMHITRGRAFSSSSAHPIVDLRSDTVTQPSTEMLQTALVAKTGDDVMHEDPTINELEEYTANLCQKPAALFLPTASMANLVAIMAHCTTAYSEIIVGAQSHISLWEGGGAASLGNVHTRQLTENPDGSLNLQDIQDAFRLDDDDHCAPTALVCLENTHNMLGGSVLQMQDINATADLVHKLGMKLHCDGARVFNAAVTSQLPISTVLEKVDSSSICLSKGLGAPLGSMLVGDTEFIRLARRARKRCGGGMRQAGVVAAMGMFALQTNVERLAEDHARAQRLGAELHRHGFKIPRNGQIDTNIVYFGLPANSTITNADVARRLAGEYGVKITDAYSVGGDKLFRAVTHMDVDDEGVDRAAEAIVNLCLG